MCSREKFQVLHIYAGNVGTAFRALTDEKNLQEWVKRNLEILRGVSGDFEEDYRDGNLRNLLDELSFFTEEMTSTTVTFDIVHPYETYSPYAVVHFDAPNEILAICWDYFEFVD